jgi:hypothetical protein
MRLGPGLSFSWKRAVGLTGLRLRLAHTLGFPTTKSGWERKVGRGVLQSVAGLLLGMVAAVVQRRNVPPATAVRPTPVETQGVIARERAITPIQNGSGDPH